MMRKTVSNMSFAFASAFTVVLFLFFNLDNNNFHFLGISISPEMLMKGIYFIIAGTFMVIYDDLKTLIRWTAILTVITGLLILGFSGWKTILVSIFSTSIGIVLYTFISKPLQHNSIGIIAVSTFSIATALVIETAIMTFIEKGNMQTAIIASIISGFFFGILAGVGVVATSMLIAALKMSSSNKHTTRKLQQIDIDLS